MANPPDPPVECQNFSFQYKSQEKFALANISLELASEKLYILAGPTGSGKTSLIRSFNGLIPHFYHGKFYGYVKIFGQDTIEATSAQLAQKVGTVFQNPENQLFSMNVERELTFALENLQLPRKEIQRRIEKAISLTNLETLRHRSPYELSGGEQQRVAIAALLALEPDIIILDEPLSNLDPITAAEIVQLLVILQKSEGKTIILSEHRLEYVLEVIDEILVIADGKLLPSVPVTKLLTQDVLYKLGLDLPVLLQWFYIFNNRTDIHKSIPITPESQLEQLLEYCEDELSIGASKKEQILEMSRSSDNKKPPLIDVRNLSFAYEYGAKSASEIRPELLVLDDISTQIFQGEIIGIVGQNGAGKSTFIRCIAKLLPTQMGSMHLKGKNLQMLSTSEVSRIIGIMFQNADHQLFSATVREELEFSMKHLDLSKAEISKRIEETLERLQISHLLNSSPFEVSGGQKKKISLATILCRHPEILIFDEPTIGQDAKQKQVLREIIKEAHDEGKTVIIVSHDVEFIISLASRILVFDHGKILADDNPTKIFTNEFILNQAHLTAPQFWSYYLKIREKFPSFPEKLISIQQLEEYLKSCR
ncbi:MAG: ABC transporter ATP-binding protein [Promethearchaeota archaeon]